MKYIKIQGAKTHNLKNISIDIPKNQFVVITGRSGSGKSSLAFDTLYAEGQRRYVESLSTYARQFLSPMGKPPVDRIEGLCPAIAIDQKGISHNPRSTVGTMTELYDYFRVLFARVGTPCCPKHLQPLEKKSLEQIVVDIFTLPEQFPIAILANIASSTEHSFLDQIMHFQKMGYQRARINHEWIDNLSSFSFVKDITSLQLVVDRIFLSETMRNRLIDSLELAFSLSNGSVTIMELPTSKNSSSDEKVCRPPVEKSFSLLPKCPSCLFEASPLTPQHFSFNHSVGACSCCDGLGVKSSMDPQKILLYPSRSLQDGAIAGCNENHPNLYQQLTKLSEKYSFSLQDPFENIPKTLQEICFYGEKESDSKDESFKGIIAYLEDRYQNSRYPAFKARLTELLTVKLCRDCHGTRLKMFSRQVLLAERTLPTLLELTIFELHQWMSDLMPKLSPSKQQVAEPLLKDILLRLQFLLEVGLDYLTLSRSADTLSGGESQRIRLASQIGSGLTGVLYVLDEPSIGLHPEDNHKLLRSLHRLKNLGNTLVVVEHDEETMNFSDFIIEIGPEAGEAGGQIIASGTPQEIKENDLSETGKFLSRKKEIQHPSTVKNFSNSSQFLELSGAKGHNLKNVSIKIPEKSFCCITGVSGSGKSTLVSGTLYPVLAEKLNRARTLEPYDYDEILGLEYFDKVITVDQNPLGKTPRSNAATYTGVFNEIRDLFSSLPESRARGYRPGRFSFNVPGGRCEACEGDGVIKVSMHFLPDLQVVCEQCQGRRYNRATREIKFNHKSIDEVLAMSVDEALDFFKKLASIVNKLKALSAVGLGYLPLGQSATTLSGGEAQRVKLSKELAKRGTGKTIYILDEPTTGLHFADVQKLLNALMLLRDQGNTIIVIEHHLDLIRLSDWVIDLGPNGGNKGGEIVAMGPVSAIRTNPISLTGRALKRAKV